MHFHILFDISSEGLTDTFISFVIKMNERPGIIKELQETFESLPQAGSHLYSIYSYTDNLMKYGSYNSFEEAFNKYKVDLLDKPAFMWDAVLEVCGECYDEEKHVLVVINYHEDKQSKSSINDVCEEIEGRKIKIIVLDLSEKNWIKSEKDQIIITPKLDRVKALLPSKKIFQSWHDKPTQKQKSKQKDFCSAPLKFSSELKTSFPVYPVVKCEEKYLNMARLALQDGIPYLEKLTGYRYYPTTTFIIDEYMLSKLMQVTVESDAPDSMESVNEDIMEFINFINMVGLNFHKHSLGKIIFEDYKSWTKLDKYDRGKLVSFAEALSSYLRDCIYKNFDEFIYNFHIPSLSNSEEPCQICFANLAEILKILTKLEIEFPMSEFLQGYFYTPKPEIWKRYLSKEEFAILINALKNGFSQ